MIVNASGLDTSPSTGLNGNSPLIGYDTVLSTSAIVADGEDADYPDSNLANVSTAAKWVGADTTDQYLTLTMNSSVQCDYVGIARHNFGTAEIVVSLEAETAAAPSTWNEIVGEFTPSDDAPIIMRFTPALYTRLRVKLQPDVTAPEAAVIYAGRLLILQRRIYVGHTPITLGRDARITNGRAESGDFLGRIVLTETLKTAVDLQNITPSWYRSNFDPFVVAAREAPFFFAWRPEDYPDEVGFAWLTNEPQPSNQRSNGMMQVSLQMDGLAL